MIGPGSAKARGPGTTWAINGRRGISPVPFSADAIASMRSLSRSQDPGSLSKYGTAGAR